MILWSKWIHSSTKQLLMYYQLSIKIHIEISNMAAYVPILIYIPAMHGIMLILITFDEFGDVKVLSDY